ncbi:hypothetical protein [Sporomusa carbonis]|uniref:hypothetical protein n=1 Tax=Sporomusa carbonis TaxID=3076075 RepID=UPI003C7C2658
MFNLAKIIGGSVGIASVETLLTNRATHHHAFLNEYLSAVNRAPQEIYNLLKTLWGSRGMDNAMIVEASHGWLTGQGFLTFEQYAAFKMILYKMIEKQANILAFEDVFYVMAIVSLGGAVLAFGVRKRASEGSVL